VPMEADDGKRPSVGVVVSLLDLGAGKCRLILDDVRSASPQRETSWHFDCFFTHKCLESRQLEDMTLPDSEYQSLGEAVVMRLMALTGKTK